MGTPDFAVPTLERLAASDHEIVAVVTGVDRPRGRGKRVTETPVAQMARKLQLPVFKPVRVRDPEFVDQVREMSVDAIVLVAFGQIIPKELLDLPPYGCINVHPSLLPKYRGASPIQGPLLNGETITGVTTMIMNERLDAGDIVLQRCVPIDRYDNAGDLHDRLAVVGADLLMETLERCGLGAMAVVPQDEARATYAHKVQSTQIDWEQDAADLCGTIRGLAPFPGAYTFLGPLRVKLLRAVECSDDHVDPVRSIDASALVPGTVRNVDEAGIVVQTRTGSIRLVEVQPEGKRPMGAADFARGYKVEIGTRFELLDGTS